MLYRRVAAIARHSPLRDHSSSLTSGLSRASNMAHKYKKTGCLTHRHTLGSCLIWCGWICVHRLQRDPLTPLPWRIRAGAHSHHEIHGQLGCCINRVQSGNRRTLQAHQLDRHVVQDNVKNECVSSEHNCTRVRMKRPDKLERRKFSRRILQYRGWRYTTWSVTLPCQHGECRGTGLIWLMITRNGVFMFLFSR